VYGVTMAFMVLSGNVLIQGAMTQIDGHSTDIVWIY
jgi:hypothetical protein